MNFFKSIGLSLFFTFLLGCFGGSSPTPQATAPPEPIRDDADYDRIRREDTDRRDVLNRSKKRYTGRACEDEDRNHDCKDTCRDIYTSRSDKDDCEELPVDQVASLEDLHKLLKKPDDDDLAEVDFEDFDVYLNISIKPLDKLIGKYSKSQAREFMFWLIENEDIAQVFAKEDDEYDALESLLKEIDSNCAVNNNDIHKCFIARVDGSDRLMELAIDSGSEDIMEWFMDFINEKHSGCENDDTAAHKRSCLATYCRIGKGIDDDEYRDDWLSFEAFEEYIEDVISKGVNSNAPDIIPQGEDAGNTSRRKFSTVTTTKKAPAPSSTNGGRWCRGLLEDDKLPASCTGNNSDRQIEEVDDLGEDWTAGGADNDGPGLCGGTLL